MQQLHLGMSPGAPMADQCSISTRQLNMWSRMSESPHNSTILATSPVYVTGRILAFSYVPFMSGCNLNPAMHVLQERHVKRSRRGQYFLMASPNFSQSDFLIGNSVGLL